MNAPIVRMYVDENGHQWLKGDLSNNNKRFLCLTGIIMRNTEHDILTTAIDCLKLKHFGTTNIILHRREIISAKPPFEALKDKSRRDDFDRDFLEIVQNHKYRVICIVIDKMKLVEKFGVILAQDPYALALEYLMQRYLYWMQDFTEKFSIECYGDMLAESRGGNEDLLTKTTYTLIYDGKGYNSLKDAGKHFSSREIKLKKKIDNIAGLQFVDLLSHPARRYVLMQNDLANNLNPSSYEQSIADIFVKSKFRRSNGGNGKIEGYGTVLFPT